MEELFKKRKEQLAFFKELRNKVTIPKKVPVPKGIYNSCPKCQKAFLPEEIQSALYVCPHCGHYLPVHAYERIEMVADPGTFKELNGRMKTQNVLGFPGYEEKIAASMTKTKLSEAVVCGTCRIDGHKAALGVMDSRFFMGSMGAVVGEKVTQLIEYATKKQLPLIIFCASGGARMQEGMVSLMQMAKTSAALGRFQAEGLLYISCLTHPTTGGVTASFASLGDIILAEPEALIGFAGPRVIEQTIKQQLPEGFQRAEFLLEHGFIDRIVPRKELRRTLALLLRLHMKEGR